MRNRQNAFDMGSDRRVRSWKSERMEDRLRKFKATDRPRTIEYTYEDSYRAFTEIVCLLILYGILVHFCVYLKHRYWDTCVRERTRSPRRARGGHNVPGRSVEQRYLLRHEDRSESRSRTSGYGSDTRENQPESHPSVIDNGLQSVAATGGLTRNPHSESTTNVVNGSHNGLAERCCTPPPPYDSQEGLPTYDEIIKNFQS